MVLARAFRALTDLIAFMREDRVLLSEERKSMLIKEERR